MGYRAIGRCNWVCGKGHQNSVLPSDADITEMNRNLLMHPEYYTDRCGTDSMALRRFRLCPPCVREGLLTFAVHEAGCKQWPGTASAHRHCFCFHCTKTWGQADGCCNHAIICQDCGIQQVRRTKDGQGGEMLEIGFIDAQQYIMWLRGGSNCPPTRFPPNSVHVGVEQVLGGIRQGALGMENRVELRKAMEEGTS